MKHIVPTMLFSVAFLLSSLSASAGFVTPQKAAAYVNSIPSKDVTKSRNNAGGNFMLIWDSNSLFVKTKSTLSDPTFYVFEKEGGRGFAIVSADDSTKPLLVYSEDGSISSPNEIPDDMADLLEWYDEQIVFLRENNIQTKTDAELSTTDPQGNIVVQLNTALWDQEAPYNLQCPTRNGVRCLTGCVATAAAIVMKYHKWPKSGKGIIDAYDPIVGVPVAQRNLNHKYDWDLMPDEFIAGQYTNEQANEVSRLMADIGAAFNLGYGTSATGGTVKVGSLKDNFSYPRQVKTVYRATVVGQSRWIAQMKNEIDCNRPILYQSADSDEGGHVFVLDGYTDEDYFHVNWGWSGRHNCWCLLSDLIPKDTDYNFKMIQRAILNMGPDDGSQEFDDDDDGNEDLLYMYCDGMTASTKELYQNEDFTVTIGYHNPWNKTFDGYARVGKVDEEGAVQEWVSNEVKVSLPSGYADFFYFPCKITTQITSSERLRSFYRVSDSQKWHLVTAWDRAWELVLKEKYYISDETSVDYNKKTGIITINTLNKVSLSVLSDKGTSVPRSVREYSNGYFEIDTSKMPSGNFKVILSRKDDKKEIEFEIIHK